MPLHIKKVFKLDQEDAQDLNDYNRLCLTTIQLGLADRMMKEGKEAHVEAMMERQQILHAVLLDKYDYPLDFNDVVQFNDQVGVIKVFSKCTLEEQESDET